MQYVSGATVPWFGFHRRIYSKSQKTNDTSLRICRPTQGLETAMSLLSALPSCDVKCTLGKSNFKRIDLDKINKNVVLCIDNDLKEWRKDTTITDAAERLISAEKTVWIASPDMINNKKTDFNDVLLSKGKQSVIDTLHQSLLYNKTENDSDKSLRDIIKINTDEVKIDLYIDQQKQRDISVDMQSDQRSVSLHGFENISEIDQLVDRYLQNKAHEYPKKERQLHSIKQPEIEHET